MRATSVEPEIRPLVFSKPVVASVALAVQKPAALAVARPGSALVKAQTRTALQTLDKLELKISEIDHASLNRRSNWQFGLSYAAALGGFSTLLCSGEPMTALLAVVPVGIAIAIGQSKGRGASRTPRAMGSERADALTKNDYAVLRDAGKQTTGLERAFLAARAGTMLTGFNLPHEGSIPGLSGRALQDTAGLDASCTPEEIVEAQAMMRLYSEVFRTGFAVNRKEAGGYRDKDDGRRVRNNVASNIERITLAVEALSPAARAIIAPVISDTVTMQLTGLENRWRLTRFLDALEGKRAPYSTETFESAKVVDLSALRADATELALEQAIAHLSLQITKQTGAGMDVMARTVTECSVLAEQAAAFFERDGLRATLLGGTHGTTVVVFNPSAKIGSIA